MLRPTPSATRAAGVVALIMAIATVLLTVGHAGIRIPGVSSLGPDTGRAVWPAAIAFGVASVLYLVIGVALSLRLRASWPVPGGAVLFGLTVLTALVPFRGAGSVVGAVLGVLGLGLLLVPGR